MKNILLPALLLFIIPSFAQITEKSKWQFVGQLNDSSVKAFSVALDGQVKMTKDFLVYKNGNQFDTLELNDSCHNQHFADNCLLRAIQIDGIGLKEILITYSVTENFCLKDEPNKTKIHHYEHTMNEIWNLDSGKQLFRATSNYYTYNKMVSYLGSIHLKQITDSIIESDTCNYSCRFSIDEKGAITIKDSKTNHEGRRCGNDIWIRRRSVGTYIFKQGKYIFISKK